MITIPEAVEKIIKSAPFLEEALAEEIINLSSLARKIKPEVEELTHKPVKEGAIVMALKRRSTPLDTHINVQIRKFLHHLGDITVRSGLTDYTIRNSSTLLEKQETLFKILGKSSDVFYTVSQGVTETTFVLSASIEDKADVLFKKEHLISKTGNLSSITIKLPKDNTKISGGYYFIFKKIAWEGISIIEVISTTNEFTIVVDDHNIDRAFSILKSLKKG